MRDRISWHGVFLLAALAVSGALMLDGCAAALDAVTAAPAPTKAPIVATVVQCPTVHEFSPAQNAALGAALNAIAARAKTGTALPEDSIWHDVAEDDQKQRAQARACIAANTAK